MIDPRALVPPLNEWHDETENYCVFVYEDHLGAEEGVSHTITREQRAEYEAKHAGELKKHIEWLRWYVNYPYCLPEAQRRLRRIADMLEGKV